MNILISSINKCRNYMRRLIIEIGNNYGKESPELGYAFNIYAPETKPIFKNSNPLSILDGIINNGFLWAVPKHRRSLERRMTRRMGFGKLILPKKNIVSCEACGHFHPIHTVCGNCYEKVKEETEIMQEAIFKELKLNPIDKDVVVLYENDPRDDAKFKGKRIIELQKERPKWFSKNLLVKDSELPREKLKAIGTAQIPPTIVNEDK